MKYKIEKIIQHYENLQVKFVGDKNWYYVNTEFFEGMEVDGILVEKRTRIWLEKEIGLAEAIKNKDTYMIKQIEENAKKGQVVRVI